MIGRVTPDIIDSVVKLIPDAWLVGDSRSARATNTGTLTWLPAEPARPRMFFPEEAIRARSLYV
jgi:hypothetical protein